jgi:ATP synthase protein I
LLLDNLFGTKPWLTMVFFFLGAGAGIRGVYRAAREMNREPDAAETRPDKPAGP